MTSSATRPPWLYKEHELEKFVEKCNPSLNISDLRLDRNGCQLVNSVLDQIISKQNTQPPGEWEMNLARIHLAVDLQNILKRWCGIGLQKTLEGSALRNLFSSEVVSVFGEPVNPEAVTSVTKVEATSPSSNFPEFGPRVQDSRFQGQTEAWASRYHPYDSLRGLSTVTRADNSSLIKSRPSKRPLEDADRYREAAKMIRIDKSSFVCPYYARNPHTHVECAGKTFPNPRKLKEHVWRFLKPFKCPNCGEGFGREKTRAIHCEQRKTKCTKAPSSYEGSPDHRRDRRIEIAKSTEEMIEIFEKYEVEKELSQSRESSSTVIDSSLEYPAEERSSSPESRDDSINGSLGNTSDGELDPRVDEYMQISSGVCQILSSTESHYVSQQGEMGSLDMQEAIQETMGSTNECLSPHTSEGRRYRRFSLDPSGSRRQAGAESNTFTGFNRRKSAPPFPSTTSDTFTQLNVTEVPEIVVTQADSEPQSMSALNRPTHSQSTVYQDNPYCPNSTGESENPYSEVSIEEQEAYSRNPFTAGSRGSARELMVLSARPPDHSQVPNIASGGYLSGGYGGFAPFIYSMANVG